MRFEFSTASRIIFGEGTVKEVGPLAAGLGKMALVATGLANKATSFILDLLAAHGVGCVPFYITHEPSVGLLIEGISKAQRSECDLVIGLGGGSAIDAAKAIAILMTNPGDPFDYLEVIGRNMAFIRPALPSIAIPTTAGTGAEVTRNAVISSPEHRVKVSLRSPWMLPRLAIVDPELTYTLPATVTASTGMDAITQLIEPFVSQKSNPVTDGLCRDGLRRAAQSLLRAYKHNDDRSARQDMALASLFGGLALANAGLGAVHGIASVLGGAYQAPHGAVCARLLPWVMEANIKGLMKRGEDSLALERYTEISRIITGSDQASAMEGVAWIHQLSEALAISPLSSYGIVREDFPGLIEKSAKASSTKANPILLSSIELEGILEKAW